MTKLVWMALQKKAEDFFYSSFQDMDYNQVQDYAVIKNTNAGIVIVGKNKEQNKCEVHWATNDASVIITEVEELKENVLVPRIPSMWESEFLLAGFYRSTTKDSFTKDIQE